MYHPFMYHPPCVSSHLYHPIYVSPPPTLYRYLSNQILPPITRLCDPIEGTSAAILSTKLGKSNLNYQNSHPLLALLYALP